MTVRHGAVVLASALSAGMAVLPALSVPAWAHGATSNPVSRASACGPEGGAAAGSAACRAANRMNGPGAVQAWDDIRVANVNGRDRRTIPDGRLCSGGLDRFRGLDLARADWPATRLTAGAPFRFGYRVTIPHRGAFRLYVTRAGRAPARPLRWADLQTRPFLTVTDPPRKGGSYVFTGRLPGGLSGRHMIFMIWQNSDTPDTYYSCSDVIFSSAPGGAGAAGDARRSGASAAAGAPRTREPATPGRTPGQTPGAPGTSGRSEPPRTSDGTVLRAERAASEGDQGLPGPRAPVLIGAAVLAVVVLAGGGLAGAGLRRRRRIGAGGRPGPFGPP